MRLAWKTKKSFGMRVEARVHRLIKEGDTARAAGRWFEAITAYRAALTLAPKLQHIVVQLGHMLKHLGQTLEADAAYAEAARLRPKDTDALWHRGQLAIHRGSTTEAILYFCEIVRRDSAHAGALAELGRLIVGAGPLSPDQILRLAEEMATDAPIASRSAKFADCHRTDAVALARPLVFELTDLIGHYRDQRLVNGMQRLQTEVLSALLEERPADQIAACCFVNGLEGWREVPLTLCCDLIRLSGTGCDVQDPEWQAARTKLFFRLALAEPYVLPWRATLVNLGTSFWVHDYFRFIRNAKAERQISYVPLVYDLIPVVQPQFCVRGWIQDFTIWLIGVFQHADAFIAISHSAKQDLLSTASLMGHIVPEHRVEVVSLDADFRRFADDLPVSALEKWQLKGTRFALLVATIEPRKNHALAFDVWADLLRRHGPDRVPRLVCMGRDGWMNDAVFDRLDTDATLHSHVTLIKRTSDAELALLYRECQFTIFPSLYEGWGLPVTESLCYGRVPIVADNSSLLEAGGGLALHFESGSSSALAAAVEKIAFEPEMRKARELKIAAEFAPRSWMQIARQIEEASVNLLRGIAMTSIINRVETGLYYPVKLYDGEGIWHGVGSGEIFRIGDGWLPPDIEGCRTNAKGGALSICVDKSGPMRIYIGVLGLETMDCPVVVSIAGVAMSTMNARSRKCGWLACDLPAETGPDHTLLVRGSLSEVMPSPRGGHRVASVAVTGFFVCGRDDAAANNAFILARRSGLEVLEAYRKV